jgi:hypothetical protein
MIPSGRLIAGIKYLLDDLKVNILVKPLPACAALVYYFCEIHKIRFIETNLRIILETYALKPGLTYNGLFHLCEQALSECTKWPENGFATANAYLSTSGSKRSLSKLIDRNEHKKRFG